MKIAVVGPGALGCLIATRLHLRGQSPVLIDYKKDRASFLDTEGIFYSEPGKDEQLHFPVTTKLVEDIAEKFDIVIFCVKAYSLEQSISSCRSLFTKKTVCLFMQNGISHLKPNLKTQRHICFGSTTEGAHLTKNNYVRHAGKGKTYFGFLEPPSPKPLKKINKLARIFSASGLEADITPNITTVIWEKLLVNIGINGLTAIHDCANGQLLTNDKLKARMIAAVEEAKMVAAENGITFQTDPQLQLLDVCRKTANNISSMLQDVRLQRKTEIEAINGALIVLAEQAGIDCPENKRIVAQINTIESEYEDDEK